MNTVAVRAHARRRPFAKMREETTLRLREEVLHDELVREVAIALREFEVRKAA